MKINRRHFLTATGAFVTGNLTAQPPRRLKVAAIYTVLRFRSHAHNILESFLRPYLFNGKVIDPGLDVVSLYADQRAPDIDTTDEVSKQFKIPVFKSIEEALTLGGRDLAVDAVLSIGEHGDYRTNDLGQVEYPRKRFFDAIVDVMKKSNRFVPVFNDKHLAYRWDWAKEIYDTAQKHRIPLLAGSSVPLAQRQPNLELPAGASIEEAVSIHGGPLEGYDFHAFEILQSHVESRKGGESGIRQIEFVAGDDVLAAGRAGKFSLPLVAEALRAEFGEKIPELGAAAPNEKPVEPHALLLTYKDGFKATILKFGQKSTRWNFACKLANDPKLHACHYYVGPWGNRNLFMGLSHAIQHGFKTGQAPYPVERTLLASGVVDGAMQARRDKKPLATPHLEFAYAPRDFKAMREMGASWEILKKVTETKGLDPIGAAR